MWQQRASDSEGFNSHTYADVANQYLVQLMYRIDQYRLMRRLHDTFVRQLFYALYMTNA